MSNAAEEIKGTFEFHFGDGVGKKWFSNSAEFFGFVNEERQRWQWVFDLRSGHNRIGNVFDLLNQGFTRLIEAASNWQNVSPADTTSNQQHFNNIQNLINNSFGEGKLILSESPKGKFILQIAESNKVVAACTLGFILGSPVNPNIRESVEGAFRAIAFDQGLQGISEAERATISKVREDHFAIVEAAKKLAVEQRQQFSQTAEAGDSFITAFQERSGAAETKASEEWEALKKTFREEIALRAPVTYWVNKAQEHSRKSRNGWISFCSVAAVFLIAIYSLVFKVWDLPARFADSPSGSTADLKHWEIGFLLLLIVVGAWLLRIIMRLILSHTHLCRDAEEKKISIETYLSLLETKAVPENQRQLVLEAIFRHAPSGLIKDDGMPPSVYDAVSKVVNRLG